MPSTAPPSGPTTAAKLAAIGARLRTHRRALGVNATTVAETAGMSRLTLDRIERGEPSVPLGAYMSAVLALGLDLELIDPRAQHAQRGATLPETVRIADYPQLKRIAWQLDGVEALTPKEALALYERNWRHVDRVAMDEEERTLVRRLVEALGGERLLV
jgi:transcriptional regulator with XRE-family HTH domain